jgi:hypothetical protein
MKTLKRIGSWLWRLAAAGLGHAGGLMLGGAVAVALGLEPPRPLPSADPATGALLLLPGGMALALGLAVMAAGIAGPRWRRWAILGAFAFVVNGVGTALELSEFSTLGGGRFSTVANLPASLLCALIVAMLFPPQSEPGALRASGGARAFFSRPAGRLTGGLLLAFLAFPFFYFLFGLMIAPIVLPYYERIDFIVVPPLATILLLLCIRSALFLLVSIPVVICWGLSRGRLAFALAAGHFTAVGLSGLVQATFFPTPVRLAHGAEILATSVCYGLALAWLLFTPPATPPRAAALSRPDEL